MVLMNVFRILGDVSHTVSKCILIWAIHSNRSAEGVSLITQILYAAVFCTRYLDLFWVSPLVSEWNFTLKIFYITSSLYIIFIMMQLFARTREQEKAWKFGFACLAGSIVLAPFVTMIGVKPAGWTFMEFLWTFSIILESVCVLPQLLLLRQTTVPTVIDSFYLLTLGSYRAFYILNWIFRAIHDERKPEGIAVVFGIIQTAFYIDFAWVYYTRQRVKLRNGGLVDSDDLSRGWLMSKILGNGAVVDEEEGINGQNRGHGNTARHVGSRKGWGARGISVSADEGLSDDNGSRSRPKPKPVDSDSVSRSEEAVGILGGDEDEDSDEDFQLPNKDNANGVGNGAEWRKT